MPIDDPTARDTSGSDVLSDYTAHLAHDLNNLFSVVIGSLGIVLEDYARRPLDEEGITLIEDAVSAGRDGARLVDALLAAAGRQALQRASVPMAAVLASVEEQLARTADPSVTCKVTVERGIADAWTDRGRARQCLLALCDNACEAMTGGGTLHVEASSGTLPGGARCVAVRVVDDGKGMPEEVLARAREPFFSTHSPRRGRGLGLSIADGFARQCQGTLEISSAPGSGTTVTLSLPVAD